VTVWKQSSRCSAGGCVQVAHHGGRVEVRDSNRPDQVAWFSERDWAVFVAGVKAGEFDGPAGGGSEDCQGPVTP
jgi:hypothetical protein